MLAACSPRCTPKYSHMLTGLFCRINRSLLCGGAGGLLFYAAEPAACSSRTMALASRRRPNSFSMKLFISYFFGMCVCTYTQHTHTHTHTHHTHNTLSVYVEQTQACGPFFLSFFLFLSLSFFLSLFLFSSLSLFPNKVSLSLSLSLSPCRQ